MKNEMKIQIGSIFQLTVGDRKIFYKKISDKVIQFITAITNEELEGPMTPMLKYKVQLLDAANQEVK